MHNPKRRRRQSNRYREAEQVEREAVRNLSKRALDDVRDGDERALRRLANLIVKGVIEP